MVNSFDYSKVNFEDLRESGLYEEELLEALKHERFEHLERADIKEKLESKAFVEPLLYACVNSRNVEMYQLYAHLNDKVRNELLTDYNLSCNILTNAPEVIEKSPLAEDKNAILANVSKKPEIVRYVSEKVS